MDRKTFEQLVDSLKDTESYISDMNTHEILYMSDPAMKLFGLETQEDYCGRKCHQVLHGIDRPCTFCTNSRVASERSFSWVQYNHRLETWMLVTDYLNDVNGRDLRVETLKALHGHQLWKQELTRQLNMETILLQCIQTLSMNGDMHTAVSSFLNMVSRFYCADRSYIFEFDLENGILNNTFEWCAEGVTSEIDKLQNIPLSVVDDWMAKFHADGEFYISSINTELDPNSIDYKLLEMQQIDSLMAVPLYSDGMITGFIGVDNPEANTQNITLLRATSDFVAMELNRRRIQAELEYLSYTDTLTGTYNRYKYVHDLNGRYKTIPKTLGIFTVNINGLKTINSTFGTKYGDAIIIKTAKLLSENVPYDIYRIGGDDFIIPCSDITREDFLQLEHKLRDAFKTAPECDVSIGTSWGNTDIDINTQFLRADEQMRAEKQAYYHTAYTDGHLLSTIPAAEVLEEIAAGRFLVYYQPKVDLQTKTIIGAEALVRKIDKDGSMVPPSQFVPQYEALNVLMHVDLHVLETTLATLRTLRDRGIDLCISVNFSRSTLLLPDFVNRILTLCAQYGVPTSSIMLEVTETISTIDFDRLRNLLQEIRQAGLHLSLDDFGSKYSNTSILADIEFDEVKLDKTLVDNICHNTRSRTILKNLMGMCQELENTRVVAEGIETPDQADLLAGFSCDCGQGFHFYRPIPYEQFLTLLNIS